MHYIVAHAGGATGLWGIPAGFLFRRGGGSMDGHAEDDFMRMLGFVLAVAGLCATGANAQSSLFDRYDVNLTKWAQLPPGAEWAGETSWVAADGKGQVIVLVRKAPYFRVFTADGKFVRS